jgi:hypothetical protein
MLGLSDSRCDYDVDRILNILKNEGTYDTQLGWKPNQLFAPLSQLGFDPTVNAVVSDGNTLLCWEFTIEGSTYRTVGLPLAYATTYYPFSRARRVFKVHPAVDGKVLDVTYVVKDFHPRDDVLGEKLLQDRILNSLNDEDATETRKYFMTIKHDECVSISDVINGSDEGKTPSLPDSWSQAKWATVLDWISEHTGV